MSCIIRISEVHKNNTCNIITSLNDNAHTLVHLRTHSCMHCCQIIAVYYYLEYVVSLSLHVLDLYNTWPDINDNILWHYNCYYWKSDINKLCIVTIIQTQFCYELNRKWLWLVATNRVCGFSLNYCTPINEQD